MNWVHGQHHSIQGMNVLCPTVLIISRIISDSSKRRGTWLLRPAHFDNYSEQVVLTLHNHKRNTSLLILKVPLFQAFVPSIAALPDRFQNYLPEDNSIELLKNAIIWRLLFYCIPLYLQ